MKAKISFFSILLFLSISVFSQEKLDAQTMKKFYIGFQHALNSDQYYKARILRVFSDKYPDKDYYGIQKELEKVEYDFDSQVIVFNELYEFLNFDRENLIRMALKDGFLLTGETLEKVTNYIVERKYRNE
jgi:hypothetical protein